MAATSTKQRVKLRERETSDSTVTLLLDWFKDGKRKREFLNLQVIKNPKNPFERSQNKEAHAKAEFFRSEREKQFFSDEIDEIVEQKKARNQDFYSFFDAYVESYNKKDIKVMKAVLTAFKEFAPPPLSAKQIDENMCIKFKDHLETAFNGETPQTYFQRFKKFLTHCSKGNNKLFKISPAIDVKNTKKENNVEKDTLTIEELQTLVKAKCGNLDVKNAFLFACNTGLRFTDIKSLTWRKIKEDHIQIDQNKTDISVKINLNENAKKFLGERGKDDDLVFKIPSHNATSKNLENWAKRAEVDKHITFHCARHTFGTLLAYYENDVLTISKLMGHTSMKHTTKYIRVADEIKKKAVNSIPSF